MRKKIKFIMILLISLFFIGKNTTVYAENTASDSISNQGVVGFYHEAPHTKPSVVLPQTGEERGKWLIFLGISVLLLTIALYYRCSKVEVVKDE